MSCALALTQVVNQRVELWVNGVKRSSHLSEGEAFSQGSIALDADPGAVIDLVYVGRKRINRVKPPVFLDGAVGDTKVIGFVSSDPAIAEVTGECNLLVKGVGTVTVSAVAR